MGWDYDDRDFNCCPWKVAGRALFVIVAVVAIGWAEEKEDDVRTRRASTRVSSAARWENGKTRNAQQTNERIAATLRCALISSISAIVELSLIVCT